MDLDAEYSTMSGMLQVLGYGGAGMTENASYTSAALTDEIRRLREVNRALLDAAKTVIMECENTYEWPRVRTKLETAIAKAEAIS